LDRDYNRIIKGIEQKRTVYGTLNFSETIQHLPTYDEIVCMELFADVDLLDEIKQEVKRRGRWKELKETVKEAIKFVYEKFCWISSPKVVYLMDSGGGFYVFVHHRVTLPISKRFNKKEKGQIFKELCKRFNNFLRAVREEAKQKVPNFEKTLKIDLLNNNNRQFKVIFSLHKTIDDTYVHPIDPQCIDFDEPPWP